VPRIRIAAPAKLNLHLRVGDRRSDGFHEIESLFLALGFGDTILIEALSGASGATPAEAGPAETGPAEAGLTSLHMDWQLPGEAEMAPRLSPEENIVSAAVSLFRNRSGYDARLRVSVEKRIPIGGGLGGGSSDAAATLLALNRLAAPGGLLGLETLAEMGAALGSDVPFFVRAAGAGTPAAWVSGRGERVQPVELPEGVRGLSLLLLNPGFRSDTAGAYRSLDEHRGAALPASRRGGVSPGAAAAALAGAPRDWPFSNDFLSVFEAGAGGDSASSGAALAYREMIRGLKEFGADFAGLSGSGSTCFGVFSQGEKAKTAIGPLSKRWPFVFETFACVLDSSVLKY